VAALSARCLAEAAALEGFSVVALDLFGDRDTRRAAPRWQPIGSAARLRIDAALLLNALQVLAERDEAQGWIAGSGFDGRPELLQQGAQRLPLIGNAASTVRRVRDPEVFFAELDHHGIAHPAVLHAWPRDADGRLLKGASGWLLKDAGGSGGWHIRRAAQTPSTELQPGCYLQRECSGTSMSATFVADGRHAVVLGCNEQLTLAINAAPWAYAGVIGPVPISEAVARQVHDAVHALVVAFGVRGLCSLDFLLGTSGIEVLELNPRPSASLELYALAADGPLRSHLRACGGGALTPLSVHSPAVPRGNAIVFARGPLELDARAAERLAAEPDVHDVPQPGSRFARGDPVCSVGAQGPTTAALRAVLAARRETLLATLETLQ
jgi:predicted ATP-grasp superfamily ATP-dependent carboligase